MQLRRLEVTNIRSYEHGTLDFGPRTTLVVGDVGAGKTSLLYAIEMALFGAAEVDAAYLVRHGAAHAQVAVWFEDADHRYEISRRFRRVRRRGRETFEPEKITFLQDGELTSYSATEIRHRVIELLGFPDNPNPQAHSDLWRWAIYVPQERMREILSADPEDRLETVRKALGVERYRTAAENAQLLAADLRALGRHHREEAGRMAHFDVDHAEALREADRLRAESHSLSGLVAERTQDVETARARARALEEEGARLEADRRELDGLLREEAGEREALATGRRLREERLAEIEARTKEAAAARHSAEELPGLRAQLETAESDVERRRVEMDRLSENLRELAAVGAESKMLERRTAESRDRMAEAMKERELRRQELEAVIAEGPAHEPPAPTPASIGEIEGRLRLAREREAAALDRLSRARAALGQIEELLAAGVCPTCLQAVRPDTFGPHRTEAAERVRIADAEHRTAVAATADVEGERKARERYERALDRWRDLDRRRTALRDAIARLDESTRSAALDEAEGAARLAVVQETRARLAPVEDEEAQLRIHLAEAEADRHRAATEVERAALAAERATSIDSTVTALTSEVARLDADLTVRSDRAAQRGSAEAAVRARIVLSEGLPGKLAEARTVVGGRESSLAEARAALIRAETRLDNEVQRAAAAEAGRARRMAILRSADDVDARAAWVAEPFRQHVLAMERELLAHAQITFEREFARYFASLVDDPALIARTDAGFTPEVTIEGEATPAEALSGGERTSLALAFRLALASVVRTLGAVRLETLLLDEPTDGFSSEQVVRMGELLEELGLPQVVVVSHEDQLAAIADRTVRVSKVNGRSVLEAERRTASDGAPAVPPATEGPIGRRRKPRRTVS